LKKKILITGSNGLLGQKLVYKLINSSQFELIATAKGGNRLKTQNGYTFETMDITNATHVAMVLRKHVPDIIIHTAAKTNVDDCEKEQDDCINLNVNAVKILVEKCSEIIPQVHFIHLSTDFIFDGENGPYTEEDIPNPISFYGNSKLQAEIIVKNSNLHWAIARTIIVYGITDNMSRSNIVLWAKEALENKKEISVVDDQFRSPTLAEDLADGCLLIAEKNQSGVFNISGKNTMSILELVYTVANFFELDKQYIKPIKSNTLNQAAKRPPRTGFDISKAETILGYKPHSFEEGIAVVIKQVEDFKKENVH
jgi:dTDP-4-dehydrorhamnose reductase